MSTESGHRIAIGRITPPTARGEAPTTGPRKKPGGGTVFVKDQIVEVELPVEKDPQ